MSEGKRVSDDRGAGSEAGSARLALERRGDMAARGPTRLPVAIDLGRAVLRDPDAASAREWLVTNGLGSYASGTVAGILTRRYHGLLIAALDPPLGRTLLVSKVEESVDYGGERVELGANRWAGGTVSPRGYRFLERFRLEGTTPVWTFAIGDALLEKRLWMEPEADVTYVRYRLLRASGPLGLELKVLVDDRDHHGETHGLNGRLVVEEVTRGLKVTAMAGSRSVFLLSDRATASPRHSWHRYYHLSAEAFRGLPAEEDHFHAGHFAVTLRPGEALTFAAATCPEVDLDGAAALARRVAFEQELLARSALEDEPDWIRQLVLAAAQFLVRRPLPGGAVGRTVIAGYPWFGDWGRDTMIALPGLTLATGRAEEAATVLRTYARFVDGGMLPNRFPDEGETPEYNTVDATLWYFEAIRACHVASGDDGLVRELFPVLEAIVEAHLRGTRFGIGVDPDDGLLAAGQEGVQLTWMDAKVDGWVVTPRQGKPVEINALWYHGLCTMADFAATLGAKGTADRYRALAGQVEASFERFWNPGRSCLYDVIDGPEGVDEAVRPNQLLAVSLLHSPLAPERQRAVVEICARRLLTSYGLRSLSPDAPGYRGSYGGDRRARDGAYHQGTAWSWLIGPFVDACLRVGQDPETVRSFLEPFRFHLEEHGLGSVAEIFDGDPPFAPRGAPAQAWGVAEVLRAWTSLRNL